MSCNRKRRFSLSEGGDGNHLDLRVTMNSHSRHVNAYSQMMIASLRFHDKYKNCLLIPRFELHFVLYRYQPRLVCIILEVSSGA